MIKLKTVTPENWRLELKVRECQKKFVSDNMKLLARAYAYRNRRSNAFVIYNDTTPIGMAMYHDCDEIAAYNFSQLFIDERYQGNGYGIQASRQILEMMRQDSIYNKVVLCFIDGNEIAKNMYEKLGFHLTGERDGNEIIMEKFLE